MTTAYIGLGANLGKRKKQLRTATYKVNKIPGVKVVALSPLYYSAPQGCPGRQPDYCNAAAKLQTTLPPKRLHRQLQKAEKQIRLQCGGKPRRRNTLAARFIDIDYLLHGNAKLQSRHLTLPHPRLLKRSFVLQPLADLTGGNFAGLGLQRQCINAMKAMVKMPIILTIESGGDTLTVALTTKDGNILQMSDNKRQKGASETVLVLIRALLQKNKTTLAECDAFAFAAGPGRFSGLRLSCAICQSFAYTHNKPIIQVPTLAALAEHNYPAEKTQKQKTITTLPAHQGHHYRAECYINNKGFWQTKPPTIIRTDTPPTPMPIAQHPNATATARIALKMYTNGNHTPPMQSTPQYIRQKIAQTIKERQANRYP